MEKKPPFFVRGRTSITGGVSQYAKASETSSGWPARSPRRRMISNTSRSRKGPMASACGSIRTLSHWHRVTRISRRSFCRKWTTQGRRRAGSPLTRSWTTGSPPNHREPLRAEGQIAPPRMMRKNPHEEEEILCILSDHASRRTRQPSPSCTHPPPAAPSAVGRRAALQDAPEGLPAT